MKAVKKEYTITIYTEDYLGLINRINTIFSRRRINIRNLNVGASEMANVKKFVIVIKETEEVVQKLTGQIEKQVDVLEVYYHTNPCLTTIEYN